jgi:predicted  nucleic acid-binding Zn-ribbon protein
MNCGNIYEDDADELIDGCECGSSLFVYEQDMDFSDVSEEEKEEVAAKVQEMVAEGVEESDNIKFEFDLDSIRVQEEGVYTINVSRLLQEIPLVIKKSEGTYHIHLPSAFNPKASDLNPSELD